MPANSAKQPAETIFAFILVAFSAAAFWQAYKISGFSGPSTPGVFPMLAAATMFVASLVTLLRTIRNKATPSSPALSGLRQFIQEVTPRRHLIMLALIALYVILMPLLGFLIASALFLIAAFIYLRRGSYLISLILAALSSAVIYVIFRIVFQVVLPQGTWLQGLF